MPRRTTTPRLEIERMTEAALWNRLASQIARMADPLSVSVTAKRREKLGNESLAILRELQARGSQYTLFPWEGAPGSLAAVRHSHAT